jgi:hypothetical protein
MAKQGNKLWRIHSAFDLSGEHFGLELGGETLDRIPVVRVRSASPIAPIWQPERINGAPDQGADLVVWAGWRERPLAR